MQALTTSVPIVEMQDFFDPPELRAEVEEWLGGEPESLLIVGHGGSGKSTLSSGFPGLFVLSADNKGAGLPEVYKTRSRTFKHGEQVYVTVMNLLYKIRDDYAGAKKQGIKTIVIDTFTAFCEYMEVEILNDPVLNGKGTVMLQIPHYGVIGQRISEIIRVAKEVGVNLVCIAHVDDSQEGPDGFPVLAPSLTGRKIEGKIPAKFDHVIMMRNNEGVFTAQLKPTPEFPHAKMGMAPSLYKKAPNSVPDFTYKRFRGVLEGKIAKKEEK
jgi:hypothetical protein